MVMGTVTPYYQDTHVTIHHGDCLEVMRTLPDASVDAVVTDPPYGLGFMGKAWDALPPGLEWAEQCLRVLKPGGHVLAFGGSRTWHRLAVAVEDAGFEIRDSIAWLYGSGFPKSLDVSKAIDKAAGAEREVVGDKIRPDGKTVLSARNAIADPTGEGWDRPWRYDPDRLQAQGKITAPATPAAQQWQGWGTALKPAFEPVVVGRKPLTGTVAGNVLQHGVGALNIDACRVGYEAGGTLATNPSLRTHINGGNGGEIISHENERRVVIPNALGRWPANVILDDTQAAELDQQSGTLTSGKLDRSKITATNGDGWRFNGERSGEYEADSGGASRFFPTFRYEAKAGTAERPRGDDGTAHPTVKPLDLMRWLTRLVTPPGGTVLDPFLGSGTTAEACVIEGFQCIGIERDATYLPLAVQRLSKPIQPDMFGGVA